MKKYLLAAALVMVSASALADRVVSATSDWRTSKPDACEEAKRYAARQANYKEVVEGYSKCECENYNDRWQCNVDAKLVKE